MMTEPAQPPARRPRWRFWEGRRGEAWVGAQALLLVAYVAVPRFGPPWPVGGQSVILAVGAALAVAGAVLFMAGVAALGRSLTPLPHPKATATLVVRGPYRVVRHPIYSGVALGALGLALATAHGGRLLLATVLLAFLAAKAAREERWLRERYPNYADYARNVRRLVPWVY